MSSRLLIAIVDNVTHDIVGQVSTFKNAQVAIRHFDDVLKDPQPNAVNKFPKDHDLVLLAVINEDIEVTPQKEILLRGADWLALQTTQQEQQ